VTFILSALNILIFPKHLWDRQRKLPFIILGREKTSPEKKNLDVMGICPQKENRDMFW
jgi:hypothetical protein